MTIIAPLTAQISVALRLLAASAFKSFDAYDTMTQTSRGRNQSRQIDLRGDFYDRHHISDSPVLVQDNGEPVENPRQQAVCAVTGRRGRLKLAHLVPASVSQEIMETLHLRYEDVWGFQNVILMGHNIEDAYDRCKLSFQRHPLHDHHYYMKIWDDSVRETLIWDGAKAINDPNDNRIGFYENRTFNLSLFNSFRRCLSYHNFVCFYKSNLRNEYVPPDYASLVGDPDSWTIKRDDLMQLRSDLDRDILVEIADNNDL